MNIRELLICQAALDKEQLLTPRLAKELTSLLSGRKESSAVLGRPKLYPDEELRQWDWNKSDIELSRDKRHGVYTIRQFRKRMGMPIVRAPNNRHRKLDEWSTLDWGRSDMELARRYSITRERVRQIRAQLGLPSRSQDINRTKTAEEERFLAWVAGRKEINFLKAKIETGFKGDQISKWCRMNGILRILTYRSFNKKLPWHLLNFQLPNSLLEEIYGFTRNSVGNYRSTHGINPRQVKISADNKEYIESLVVEERIKVANWKIEQLKQREIPVKPTPNGNS